MTTRRAVLAGLAAAASLPGATWAEAGRPTHLSAAMDVDGSFALYGLRAGGALAFRVPLPARGHAAAAHPSAAEAVAFARRPGTFALVMDCVSGRLIRRLDAPPGRHFYGHGAFSEDGRLLYTTENVYDTGAGRVGVWSREDGFRRIGDFASGGIGPHEIVRIPGGGDLAIANGGIRTHPATGRDKLNLDTMRPNLTIVSEDGTLKDVAEVPQDLHRNSLRHIAARADGQVVCAFQWQGEVFDAPPLQAIYRGGAALAFLPVDAASHRAMQAYAGSVALSGDGRRAAVTSPRGGVLVVLDLDGGGHSLSRQTDVCGVAAASEGFVATDGLGNVHSVGPAFERLTAHPVAFDNHLIRIDAA